MSKIEDLIKQYCPDGVEWKRLGDLVSYEQPSKYIVKSTNYSDEYEVPVLTAGQSFVLGYTNEHDDIYNASPNNPVIIFDDFTGAFHWVDFPFKVKSSAMKMLRVGCNDTTLRYVYHVMRNIGYTSDEHKRLWISLYSNFQIPVPHIAVQDEIVRILDKFTELEKELEKELELRRKQYEFYRDKLLTFGDDVEYKTIRDVCLKIVSGGTPKSSRADYYGGNHPWLRTQEVNFNQIDETSRTITDDGLNNSSAQYIPVWSVIVAMYGATVGRVAYNSIPLTTNQACCNLIIDDKKVTYKYVFYWLSSQYEYIKSLGCGSQTNINADTVKNLEIPVPSPTEQARIVKILDKFDTLTTSLTSGLPAEIKLRKQQYEYYRDYLFGLLN